MRKRRENERKRELLEQASLQPTSIKIKKCIYKVLCRVFHTTKFNNNYQKIQDKTLLHKEKLGRNKKELKKSNFAGVFAALRNFVGVTKIHKATTASSLLLLPSSMLFSFELQLGSSCFELNSLSSIYIAFKNNKICHKI